MHFDLDIWFISRPRWERVLIVLCIVWSAVIFFGFAVDADEFNRGYEQGLLVGPGWAIPFYFVARFASLLGKKTDR